MLPTVRPLARIFARCMQIVPEFRFRATANPSKEDASAPGHRFRATTNSSRLLWSVAAVLGPSPAAR